MISPLPPPDVVAGLTLILAGSGVMVWSAAASEAAHARIRRAIDDKRFAPPQSGVRRGAKSRLSPSPLRRPDGLTVTEDDQC